MWSKSHLKSITIYYLLHAGTWRKFYSLKEWMDSLCTPILVLQAKGRLHPWITAMLVATTCLKIPRPAHTVLISLFSEMSYSMRVLMFWLCSLTCFCARLAFECWTRSCMNLAHTNKPEVVSVQSSRRPRTVSVTSTPLQWWFPSGNLSRAPLAPVTPTGRSNWRMRVARPAVPKTLSLKTASGTPNE